LDDLIEGQSYESSGYPVPQTGGLTCGWDGAYLEHRVPTALDAMMMLTYYVDMQFEEQSANDGWCNMRHEVSLFLYN